MSEVQDQPQADNTSVFSAGARQYALGVLVVVYTFNFIDRQILSILLEPIKADLGLSDTQLGLLTGFAFALFYATMGIPIARYADKNNRRNLIALSLTIWSGFTAISGLAQNFWHLLIARIGVGVGEAGCSPPAHSLISDYFPAEKRATALGIYSLGIPVGILFGFIAGGWLNEFFGWRVAFFVVGVPGIILALAVRFSLREPTRGMAEGRVDTGQQPTTKETFKLLWSKRSFRHLAFGAALTAFVGYGLVTWVPSFLIRSHGMTTGEAGTWLGLILGIPGGIGIALGGWMADRYGSKDTRWYMWVVSVALLLGTPFAFGVFLSDSAVWCLLFLVMPVLLGNFYQATTFSQTQGLVELRMRAVAAAVLLFIINIIGLGAGPQAVGIVSDLLNDRFGQESLRYSLLIFSFVNIWAAYHYYKAGQYLKADLVQEQPVNNWAAAAFTGCTLWIVSACGGESSTSALLPSEQADPSTSVAQPNVIVLFADDLGYGDIGSFGHPYNRTPNIDELAAQGQRWTDFYVAASVCSPSRGALLTGRLPVRTGLYGETIGVYFPNDPGGFPDGEVTLPEALQEVGYRTGIFGKWHLGDAKHAWPTRHGFDEWLGLPYSNDMDVVGEIGIDQLIALSLQGKQEEVAAALSGRAAKYADPKPEYWRPPLFHSVVTADGYVDEIVEQPVDQSTLTKRYTAAAIDFIKRAGDEPFFIYLPYTMPHTPLFRSEDFVGQSIGGRYGDVIEEIDWSVGAVKQALEDSGNADNTLVIFTSDNGPWLTMEIEGGQTGLLRHGKGTTFEGGMRVPTVMWWPGRLQPGVVSEVGSAMDVFNTVASLAGADASTAVDGVDLSPVLFDGGESPRDEVAFYRRGQLYAYRKGPWKAHFITEGAYQQPPGRAVHDTPVLYHLHTDPSERFDVAADNPDVLAEIDAAVQQHLAGMQRQPPEFDKRLQR